MTTYANWQADNTDYDREYDDNLPIRRIEMNSLGNTKTRRENENVNGKAAEQGINRKVR